ncbi:HD domain-containing protein [Tepidibacter hydrothermalis]|uniref:HD domain-containing protein n=1 Tax=Tepidibacter hydrothermalis TaxID=3036126 RepID=A0ABY8EJ99_9FIRM|nr:HD domain-containing protein [Tepidibacter hydrothermalis]WFD11832.1 HD domain-containing protein [Tepidibacter hydrothermalis]
MRKGKFINTYSKIKFWPLDPRIEEIKTVDIAHALSMLCRANGHCCHFYSVAQHSINCAYEAKNRGLSEKIQLACLIHDASEAYISDITRPVKYLLNEYLEIEENLQKVIHNAYDIDDLTQEDMLLVKEIDDAMLNYEMEVLLDNYGINNLTLTKEYDISFRMMEEVEKEFIDTVNQLIKNI